MEASNFTGVGQKTLTTGSTILDEWNANRNLQIKQVAARAAQMFVQRRREREEQQTCDELARVESSMNVTEMRGDMNPKVDLLQSDTAKAPFMFDLNEVILIDVDEQTVQQSGSSVCDVQNNHNQQPDMSCAQNDNSNEEIGQARTSSVGSVQNNQNRHPEMCYAQSETSDAPLTANPQYTSAHEHGSVSQQPHLYDEVVPDPPTREEKEMDHMFEDGKYPTVREILESPAPEEGMLFESKEEAFYFFAVYARRVGFAVKKDSSYRSRKTDLIQRQTFSCTKQRSNVDTDDASRQRKSNTIHRTNCQARIIGKQDGCRWLITFVHLEHNHDLAPSEWLIRFMQCHKKMSPDDRSFIEILQRNRIPPRKIMTIFRSMRGGFRHIPFDTQDLSNMRGKERMKHKNRDIEELLQIFKGVQRKMPGFYFTLEIDEENIVRSIFWTDIIGMANYKQFGDFVSFDTTYSTNIYNMPFGPVVGVDNHGKTVIFAASLLKDEKADTFRWMFQELLQAMGGKQPETIITDQDTAMRNAIRDVLPNSKHRFCNWHIMKKMKEKLVSFFAARGSLHAELRYLIRNAFTPEEFDNGWQELMQKHDASSNDHLKRIFEIRNEWAPAYYMDKFFPFLSSSGRSESTNSLFKSYVLPKDTIVNFFEQYQIIQEKKMSDLDRLRSKSEMLDRSYWGFNPLEREAGAIYTEAIFEKFKNEMRKNTAYGLEEVESGKKFQLTRLFNYDKAEFSKTVYRVLVTANDIYMCSCSKFSRDGIQCCHVLRVAMHKGLVRLPESFVNPRWTIAAGLELAQQTKGGLGVDNRSSNTTARHSILMSKISDLFSRVSGDEKSYNLLVDGLSKLEKTIMNEKQTRERQQERMQKQRQQADDPQQQEKCTQQYVFVEQVNGQQQPHTGNECAVSDTVVERTQALKDPPPSHTKGFRLGERCKTTHEKASEQLKKSRKPKKCSLCRNEGHLKTNCPSVTKVVNLNEVQNQLGGDRVSKRHRSLHGLQHEEERTDDDNNRNGNI